MFEYGILYVVGVMFYAKDKFFMKLVMGIEGL